MLGIFDLEIAARTVWCEARGEASLGRMAVAWTLINRLRAHKWYSGQTLAETCLKASQYSCWNTNDSNRIAVAKCTDQDPILIECRSDVQSAFDGNSIDPSHGATHYYNPSIVQPSWAKGLTPIVSIGNHTFFNNVP